MPEPKFEWCITDLSETEIRGTDEVPIFVSKPYWSIVEMKYPNFTAIVHSGKKRTTHSFRSDDIETTLGIINNNGEETDVAKALATNVVWAEILMKHCKKLASKRTKKSTIKRSKSKSRSTKEIKKELTDKFTIDLNKDLNIKLNNWV